MAPAAQAVQIACVARLLRALVVLALHAVAQDVVSDITVSAADEHLALETKARDFWQPILAAAQGMQMEEHMLLYTDTEKVLAGLPAENAHVRKLLEEALVNLKSADTQVLAQAAASSQLAETKLSQPVGHGEGLFSFLTGGQGFISQALRQFSDGGRYSQRLVEQIGQRQGDILPLLRGTASSNGDILTSCRLASQRSFDVLKYDIYNRGVPRTPAAAKAVANRLVDATGETRHRYMRFITEAVQGITRDVQGKQDTAAATVARLSISKAEAQLPSATARSSKLDSTLDQVINL